MGYIENVALWSVKNEPKQNCNQTIVIEMTLKTLETWRKFSCFMTMTTTSSLVAHIEFIGPWALVCPYLHYENKLDLYLLLQRLSSVIFRAAKSIFSVVKGPFRI